MFILAVKTKCALISKNILTIKDFKTIEYKYNNELNTAIRKCTMQEN